MEREMDIQLDHVTKRYGSKCIFKEYNLLIYHGEFVCISGESGKGKSTLLNLMGALDTPDSGEIIIKNIKNPQFGTRKCRELLQREISFLFQNYGMVDNRTVLYNLQIGARIGKKSKEDIVSAMENVGLGKEYLEQKIFQLSGGEQQRVALARIALKPSSIILADEPTGSLDYGNKKKVMGILQGLHQQGKTIIVVTHDPEVVQYADRVIAL